MSDLFNVAFDEAHKPRGTISENYGEIKEHLESNGFTCHSFMEFPITRQNLGYYDILVIPCPDNAQFSNDEIDAIYTGLLFDFSREQIENIYKAANNNKIPSFALGGETYVQLGAMASITAENVEKRLSRRTALNIEKRLERKQLL